MAFLAKNWQKNASGNATRALCRVAGAGVSAYVLHKLTSDTTTNASTTIKNISGPAAVLVGVLGDLMLEDDKLRSFCQGVYTFGALKSLSVLAPSVSEPLGLSGLNVAIPATMQGTSTTHIASSTEQTTDAVPVEIQAIEQGATDDGNPWSDVADYVEQDAEAAITVSGLSEMAASMN